MRNKKHNTKKLKKIKNCLEGLREEVKKYIYIYYKPVRTKSAFNDDYVEYESRRDKDKNLLPEDYLDVIRPFLRHIKNNHKTNGEWKI